MRRERVVREVAAIASELDAAPSQVALAWLLARDEPRVLPIVGARSVAQLEQNLGSLGLELGPEHVRRLDEESAIELGFPHDFLNQESIRRLIDGDRYLQVER
jgi:aryl-alcohol dehydrogenase-like predicted oxidoreductase